MLVKCRDFLLALCRNGLTNRIAVCFVDSGGPKEAKFNRIRQVAPMCPHGRAYWRDLANTTELSVRGRDALLCQITLTTCSNRQWLCPQISHIGLTDSVTFRNLCRNFLFLSIIVSWTRWHSKNIIHCSTVNDKLICRLNFFLKQLWTAQSNDLTYFY